MKVYATETPLNSACIAPLRPYVSALHLMPQLGSPVLVIFGRLAHPSQVILGGGQDAMSVTTTSARSGKFESRFYHKLFEEEVGRVKGHL
jgi:translation initiation factor 3 subunit I